MGQKARGGRSHEELVAAREIRQRDESTLHGTAPVTEELLYFAGGDQRMTWVKGNKGMELRNVLAHRALHVEQQLKVEAVKRGLAAPKQKHFFEREVTILFKEGLSDSSEDDDVNDATAQQKRVARRIEEQQALLRIKRGEEDKRAVEALQLRRLKEKYVH
jgi:hypothetical protein